MWTIHWRRSNSCLCFCFNLEKTKETKHKNTEREPSVEEVAQGQTSKKTKETKHKNTERELSVEEVAQGQTSKELKKLNIRIQNMNYLLKRLLGFFEAEFLSMLPLEPQKNKR